MPHTTYICTKFSVCIKIGFEKKQQKVLNLLGKFKIFQMISKYFEFSAEFPRSQDIIKEHKFQKYFCHSILIHTLVLPINKQYYMRIKYCESMKIISILDFIEALYFHCFFCFVLSKNHREEKKMKIIQN